MSTYSLLLRQTKGSKLSIEEMDGNLLYLQGLISATGPQGPQGFRGFDGANGPQGTQGPQGYTGPQGPHGTSQGRILYFNSTYTQSSYYEICAIPDGITTSTVISATSGTGSSYFTHSSWLTPVNCPNINLLPIGVWDANLYLSSDRAFSVNLKVYKSDGANRIEHLATTNTISVGSSNTIQYSLTGINIESHTFSNTDRIILDIMCSNNTGTIGTLNMYSEDNTYSHIHTPIEVIAATGPQGPQGAQGVQGVTGPQGYQGPQGPTVTAGLVEIIRLNDFNTSISPKTYYVDISAQYGYTINSYQLITSAGTCSVALYITGVTISGTYITASTTAITGTVSSGGTVSVGNRVTMVTGTTSGLNNLQTAIKITRT